MDKIQAFIIRKASTDDLDVILSVAGRMGGACDIDYYRFSFGLSDAHEREVFLVEVDGEAAGFVMLNWAPKYKYFVHEGMPEIQDLNVLAEYRQRGLGRSLIEHCEDIVRGKGGAQIGIGVGLLPSYGAAQRLYVRMGYVPDGFGVTYDRKPVRAGERLPVDDEMSLMMVKGLVL